MSYRLSVLDTFIRCLYGLTKYHSTVLQNDVYALALRKRNFSFPNPLELLSHKIVECSSKSSFHMHAHELREYGMVSVSLPHHAHRLRHTSNGYITNWTILVYVWVGRSLVFFSRATSFLACFACFSRFHFTCFLYTYAFAGLMFLLVQHCTLSTFIFNSFFPSFSTVSCGSFTVEYSRATQQSLWMCVCFFLALYIISLPTFPMRISFHILNTHTQFTKNCSGPIHRGALATSYIQEDGERDKFILFFTLNLCFLFSFRR